MHIEQFNTIFENMQHEQTIWLSHRDQIKSLGKGFKTLGYTTDGIITAFVHPERRLYGMQFHPEVTHTPNGEQMLQNFAALCDCAPEWTEQRFMDDATTRLRDEIGGDQVISLYSGGGDSYVSTYIARQALGDQVIPVNIDNGLLRIGEQALIRERTGDLLGEVYYLNLTGYFLRALKNVIDPEKKRNIIGDAFLDSLDPFIEQFNLPPETKIIQGTLLTDLVESGMTGRRTATIKTHHNVNSPKALAFREAGRIVEPNDILNKDDLRRIAAAEGIPDCLFHRYPFPGPGLGVRIVGFNGMYDEDTFAESVELAQDIGDRYGLDGFASPVQTVGVGGDSRTYGSLLLFSGSTDIDQLSAAIKKANDEGGNRGVAILGHQGTLNQDRFTNAHHLDVNIDSVGIAQALDYVAHSLLKRYGHEDQVSQMPVPIFAAEGKPWIGIRPVETENYRTADVPRLSQEFLDQFTKSALQSGLVGGVVLDLTTKPPATIEWE